ncbi:hypothetical protein JOE50_008017 [Bradyrhizobium japonicum]|nr:hypothetical protein [Bradyrhizobium japonicum]
MTLHRRQRRKREVQARASEPSHMFRHCKVVGCRRPARAGTADGLDTRFCRAHADHRARHGSPYSRSFRAAEINPFRRAAIEWLLTHQNDRWVSNAVERVTGLYKSGGPYEEAFRLRGLPPRERAWKAWARLRHQKVDPYLVIAAWLAVELIVKHDVRAEDRQEFKRVQAAKIVHRLASGTHKLWNGVGGRKTELHVYPASRGLVLRYIGKDLEEAVELLCDHRLSHIQLQVKGDIKSPRAAPRTITGRRRRKARDDRT